MPPTRTRHHLRTGPVVTAAVVVVCVLVVANIGGRFVPGLLHVVLAPMVAGALVLVARAAGLTWHDLAMRAASLRRGLKHAAIAVAGIVVIYLGALLWPVTQEFFLDTRHRLGGAAIAFAALVAIPIGTVLLEEVAFRGVLWGLVSRRFGGRAATGVTSSLFGLWHILPSFSFARANHAVFSYAAHAGPLIVIGTVGFTTLAGVVLAELRRHSGSLLAPAGLHWAANALGVVISGLLWAQGG
jgi:membrane protease YdiL (CAAX protease family)